MSMTGLQRKAVQTERNKEEEEEEEERKKKKNEVEGRVLYLDRVHGKTLCFGWEGEREALKVEASEVFSGAMGEVDCSHSERSRTSARRRVSMSLLQPKRLFRPITRTERAGVDSSGIQEVWISKARIKEESPGVFPLPPFYGVKKKKPPRRRSTLQILLSSKTSLKKSRRLG